MRIITFNANGIRAAARKSFYTWLLQQAPDLVCIQETKAQLAQLQESPLFFPESYYCQYVDAQKKGYSGVAIYAKIPPLKTVASVGYHCADFEGRYLQFDYANTTVISMYFPSGSSSELRQDVKYEFLNWFLNHLDALMASGKDLILCGDFNIAHQKIDLKNWQSNQRNSGFLPQERAWMDHLLGPLGFVDAFRLLNKQAEEYSWWSTRRQSRAKNIGWRIDYQIISSQLASRVEAVSIYRDEIFSDHAPVVVDYQGNLDD